MNINIDLYLSISYQIINSIKNKTNLIFREIFNYYQLLTNSTVNGRIYRNSFIRKFNYNNKVFIFFHKKFFRLCFFIRII